MVQFELCSKLNDLAIMKGGLVVLIIEDIQNLGGFARLLCVHLLFSLLFDDLSIYSLFDTLNK